MLRFFQYRSLVCDTPVFMSVDMPVLDIDRFIWIGTEGLFYRLGMFMAGNCRDLVF